MIGGTNIRSAKQEISRADVSAKAFRRNTLMLFRPTRAVRFRYHTADHSLIKPGKWAIRPRAVPELTGEGPLAMAPCVMARGNGGHGSLPRRATGGNGAVRYGATPPYLVKPPYLKAGIRVSPFAKTFVCKDVSRGKPDPKVVRATHTSQPLHPGMIPSLPNFNSD
jgi:hypothetical protein